MPVTPAMYELLESLDLEQLGFDAYDKFSRPVPMQDKRFAKALERIVKTGGDASSAIQAWRRGWDRASTPKQLHRDIKNLGKTSNT
jgi:hypothetical protein